MNNILDLDFLEGRTQSTASGTTANTTLASDAKSAVAAKLAVQALFSPTAEVSNRSDPRGFVVPGTRSLRTVGVTPNSFACDMDSQEYHNESPGISSSRMKHMLVSPAFYQLKLQRPMLETDALRVGRMLHTQVLEPHLVDSEFVIWREGRRQSNEWAQFVIDNADRTIITEKQLECVEGMASALMQMTDFPLAAWLAGVKGQGGGSDIAPAIKEQSLFWIDEDTGLQCKARPDAMTVNTPALVGDLKSARSATAEDFINDIFKFRYDVQAAHYLAGVKAVYGVDAPFAFFVAEKEAPFVTRTFLMKPDALAHGERHRRYCLRMIRRCLDTGVWPKQPPDAKPVSVEVPFMRDNHLKNMASAYGIEI